MCLAKSDLSAFNAASTRSAITLSASSCASVLGGAEAHAPTPHNTATAMPAYDARLITRDTVLASSFLIDPLYTTPASQGGRPGRHGGPDLPATHARGGSGVHGQNLKFRPVEKPCGRQPPQVVGPALL